MNTIEVIEAVEALKLRKQYKAAFMIGIQNIDEDKAIEINIEMADEVLPVYEKKFPENKKPKMFLYLTIKFRKNIIKLDKIKLDKKKTAAVYTACSTTKAAADYYTTYAWAVVDAANTADIARVTAISAAAAADAADAAAAAASDAADASSYAAAAAAVNAVAAAAGAAFAAAVDITAYVDAADYAYDAAKFAYDAAGYEKFCCKYIDKMLEILKKEEKE